MGGMSHLSPTTPARQDESLNKEGECILLGLSSNSSPSFHSLSGEGLEKNLSEILVVNEK